MPENSTKVIAARGLRGAAAGPPRCSLPGPATVALGGMVAAVLAVPGVAESLSPSWRQDPDAALDIPTRLGRLQVGAPRLSETIEERQDAWVKYPREPVGSVWLIRQPAGTSPPVLAPQSECPHPGWAIDREADLSGFVSPCHTSASTLDGTPTHRVPSRPTDRLGVELTPVEAPEVWVRSQRSRTWSEEKPSLV